MRMNSSTVLEYLERRMSECMVNGYTLNKTHGDSLYIEITQKIIIQLDLTSTCIKIGHTSQKCHVLPIPRLHSTVLPTYTPEALLQEPVSSNEIIQRNGQRDNKSTIAEYKM